MPTHSLKKIKTEENAERIMPLETDVEVLTSEEADAIQEEKKKVARNAATGNSPAEKLARWRMVLKSKEKMVKETKESIVLLKRKIKKMEKLIDMQEEL